MVAPERALALIFVEKDIRIYKELLERKESGGMFFKLSTEKTVDNCGNI